LVREGTPAEQAAAVLDAVFRHPRHRAWSDDIPSRATFAGAPSRVIGRSRTRTWPPSRIRGGGRLLTLDRGLAAAHPEVTELVEAGDH
jgi:uncharacterized protein